MNTSVRMTGVRTQIRNVCFPSTIAAPVIAELTDHVALLLLLITKLVSCLYIIWCLETLSQTWFKRSKEHFMSRHICHVTLCHVMSCYVMLCHFMSCHVMSCLSCHVMLYHVMSCHVTLCHVMSCYVTLCHVMSCHVISRYVMSCHVTSRYVMSCHVMSCHVMSRYVMSCHVMSVTSCLSVCNPMSDYFQCRYGRRSPKVMSQAAQFWAILPCEELKGSLYPFIYYPWFVTGGVRGYHGHR